MTEISREPAKALLGKIGPRLKAARDARGLTLQEVASRTRINLGFLESIEAGSDEGLPGLTFVRGFIRNYLQVLELEDSEIEEALRDFSGLEQFAAETSLGPRISEMHGDEEGGGFSAKRMAIAGLVVVALAWGGYSLFTFLSSPGDEEPAPTARTEAPDAAGTPAAAPVEPGPPSSAAPEQPSPLEPGGRVEPPQNLRLTVKGLEATWIRLSIDRAPPFEVQLEPAETKSWDADEELRLIIGKSHGVAVFLNGEDVLLPEEQGLLIPGILLNKLTLLRLEN